MARLSSRARFGASLARVGAAAALSLAVACSVDTSDVTFLADSEFNPQPSGGSGGESPSFGGTSAGAPPTSNEPWCAPEIEGEVRCNAQGDLEVCKAESFVLLEDCAEEALCNAARKACLDCSPGTFRCTGAALEQCNLEGSAYERVRTCASKADCFAEEHSGHCAVCEPGEFLCEDGSRNFPRTATSAVGGTLQPNHALRVCNTEGSGTEAVALCDARAPVCSTGEGRCLRCEPGRLQCSGGELLRCDARGDSLELEADCGHPALCDAAAGSCKPPVCTDGSRKLDIGTMACRGETQTELAICTPNGQWEILDLCDTAAACRSGVTAGRCLDEPDDCIPGSTSCVDGALLECAPFGDVASSRVRGASVYTYATCRGECLVAADQRASCVAPGQSSPYQESVVCEPGAQTYLTCSGGGCVEESCPAGQVCAGTGLGCRSCVPGANRCLDNVLVRCDESGAGEDTVADCGTGVCDSFRGACLPARVGERLCMEGELRRVGADGMLQTIERCGSQALCDPEAGCLPATCVSDSRVCEGDEGRVWSCSEGVELLPTPTRCGSAERCEDGLGCVASARLAAGEAHTCVWVVQENGDAGSLGHVKCWGANESGQLGNGASILGDEAQARAVVFADSPSQPLVTAPRFLGTGLCAGKNFSCADARLPSGDAVVCWGSNQSGQLGIGSPNYPDAEASPVVYNHVVGAVTDGTAPLSNNAPAAPLKLGNVTCGADFACALTPDGKPYCWGANDVGQLGTGQPSKTPSTVAQAVSLGSRSGVVTAIAAGARHACALTRNRDLFCWGDGRGGQLGRNALEVSGEPMLVNVAEVTDFLVGRDFTLLASEDESEIVAFGQNMFGQLATGATARVELPSPTQGLPHDAVLRLYGGPLAAHACALLPGALSCWGANALGQLGDGTTIDRSLPVVALEARRADFSGEPGLVAAGASHSCAVDIRGTVWCWGANQRRQLGVGSGKAWQVTATPVF